jgi:hypothetical protein
VEEIPALNQLQRQMPQLVVVGADVDQDPAAYQQFLARHEVDFLTIRRCAAAQQCALRNLCFP